MVLSQPSSPQRSIPCAFRYFLHPDCFSAYFAMFSAPSLLHVVLGLPKIAPKSFKPTVNLLHSFSVVTLDLQPRFNLLTLVKYICSRVLIIEHALSFSLTLFLYLDPPISIYIKISHCAYLYSILIHTYVGVLNQNIYLIHICFKYTFQIYIHNRYFYYSVYT